MGHVLITEDDMIAAADIEAVVRSAGATSVSLASTEMEGVDSAREKTPAIIVSDVRLPSGFGPAAVRAIHSEVGAVPTIFITANTDMSAECDAYLILEKPFSAARLTKLIKNILENDWWRDVERE